MTLQELFIEIGSRLCMAHVKQWESEGLNRDEIMQRVQDEFDPTFKAWVRDCVLRMHEGSKH